MALMANNSKNQIERFHNSNPPFSIRSASSADLFPKNLLLQLGYSLPLDVLEKNLKLYLEDPNHEIWVVESEKNGTHAFFRKYISPHG